MRLNDLSILYIEDDPFIRQSALEFLSYYFDTLYEAEDGEAGYAQYQAHTPDIIITDIEMPKLDGIALVERIRKQDNQTQIIILTAHTNTDYLLKAVELKLIKYMIKPVSESTLMPVLKEALTLFESKGDNIILLKEGYRFDTLNETLFWQDDYIKLNQKERQFMSLCAKNIHRVVTYDEFNAAIWNHEMSDYALSSLVKSVRTKLPLDAVQNISGVGYRLVCA